MKLWAAKRTLVGYSVVFGAILLVLGSLVYTFYPKPSCTDGRKNGDEEEVDCGGSCVVQCIGPARDPVVVWARPFLVRPGVYDAGALIQNINTRVGVRELHYTFRVYDPFDILLDKKSGVTYLYPGEQALVYEPGFVTGNRYAKRVTFEYDSFTWELMPNQDAFKMDITERSFENDQYSRLYVTLANRAFSEEKNLEVFALLKRADDNVYALSRTTIDSIAPQSDERVSFTWPGGTIIEKPAKIEILYRRMPH